MPHKLLVAAEYEATLEEGRAVITGTLEIDVLDDGLFILPLELAGVGIRSATLDGKPAPLTARVRISPVLLVAGKGQHKLTLASPHRCKRPLPSSRSSSRCPPRRPPA